MKVYIVLQAVPWEDVQIQTSEGMIRLNSDMGKAGYMPLFWSEEAARAAYPNGQITAGDVPDDWHPFLRLGKAEPAPALSEVEALDAEAAGV